MTITDNATKAAAPIDYSLGPPLNIKYLRRKALKITKRLSLKDNRLQRDKPRIVIAELFYKVAKILKRYYRSPVSLIKNTAYSIIILTYSFSRVPAVDSGCGSSLSINLSVKTLY